MNDDNQYVEKMPESIGRYAIKACLGFGAMGAVYRAFDPLIKRTLAIKTIRLDIPRQSPQYKSFIERFYHEARISGTLSHPNIVTLYDIGEEAGVPFLAMEFADGDTIAALIERGTRFAPERVVMLVSQIASAIDYAHDKGVIHRDIKPSNLILCEGDRVKVTDFGIAKLADAEMTQSGMLLGTPAYMSPEQAMGEKLDGRSDIFSLGICAFEMLSGEQPFPGNNVTAILYKVVHVDPIEPSNLEVLGLLPDKWRAVFNQALAKKPDERYQTAAAFVHDLEYCLGSWFGSAMGDETAVLASPAPIIEQTEVMTAQQDVAARDAGELDALESVLPTVTATAPASVTDTTPPAVPRIEKTPEVKPVANVFVTDITPPAMPRIEKASEVEAIAGKPSAPRVESTPAVTPPPPTQAIAAIEEEVPTLLIANVDTGEPETVDLSSPVSNANAAVDFTTRAVPVESQPAIPTIQPERTTVPPFGPPSAPPTPTTVRIPPAAKKTSPPVFVPRKKPRAQSRPLPIHPPVSPARRPFHSRGMKRWIAPASAGTALAFIAIVFLGLRMLNANRDPSTPPATQAAVVTPATLSAPSRGTLRILSTPMGADVSVNGESRGVTPLVLTIPLGLYDVRLTLAGHDPQSHRVALSASRPMFELHAQFASDELRTTGSAMIATVPAGAAVLLDGRNVGTTPIRSLELDVGEHSIEIRKERFETLSHRFAVTVNQRLRLSFTLTPTVLSTPQPLTVDTERVYAFEDVDVRPKKLTGPHPDYPDARKLKGGESVSVTVTFVVGEDGSVSDIQISESGGADLDKAALRAIQDWKFEPGVKRGTPVKVRESRRFTYKSG